MLPLLVPGTTGLAVDNTASNRYNLPLSDEGTVGAIQPELNLKFPPFLDLHIKRFEDGFVGNDTPFEAC